jgi:hypothetical protein
MMGAVGAEATYFGGALTGTLRSAVEELGALCVGEDPPLVPRRSRQASNIRIREPGSSPRRRADSGLAETNLRA